MKTIKEKERFEDKMDLISMHLIERFRGKMGSISITEKQFHRLLKKTYNAGKQESEKLVREECEKDWAEFFNQDCSRREKAFEDKLSRIAQKIEALRVLFPKERPEAHISQKDVLKTIKEKV